jgi:hypothetical protein
VIGDEEGRLSEWRSGVGIGSDGVECEIDEMTIPLAFDVSAQDE